MKRMHCSWSSKWWKKRCNANSVRKNGVRLGRHLPDPTQRTRSACLCLPPAATQVPEEGPYQPAIIPTPFSSNAPPHETSRRHGLHHLDRRVTVATHRPATIRSAATPHNIRSTILPNDRAALGPILEVNLHHVPILETGTPTACLLPLLFPPTI